MYDCRLQAYFPAAVDTLRQSGVEHATPSQCFLEANRFSYWKGIEELMKWAAVI
jgi:hypothetical protein